MQIKSLKHALRLARELKKRKYREATGRFLIEGINFVDDAIKSGAVVDCLILTEKVCCKDKGKKLLRHVHSQGIPLFFVDEAVFAELADTETPQGVLAVGSMPVWDASKVAMSQDALLLALDGLQDPGNLGTIIRSSDGVGVDGVFLGEGTVDLYNSKVLRSTMGSVFRIPVFSKVDLVSLLLRLREAGFKIVAADPRASLKYYQADFKKGRFLILIGNESRGIRQELLDLVDLSVCIPLREEVESLNAGVAAALLLYEVYRQRDT